ncbi:DUF2855 family protein [Undibacterium sp. Jales W-56]|uniref:DUF2855 family protein n=1 Tax=Undibacterium sp. Jales W-56 TaxID=2897325 RepID=UPI0021D04645|nr:DUF2855 family protein [Undibacterium sp. Jales W-56]MCU6433791.1 DUF2855 family protein [Undibacterium sp. Jales W-56]
MNDKLTVTRLLTRKNALDQTRIDRMDIALPLQSGEILLKIDRVAVTTNNITYAAFGDAMQYWDFFPTQDPDWGHMPVWGFADVLISTVPGVEAGERFYGYFPIASHIKMRAVRISPRGFYDGSEHRMKLTSAYNQYMRSSQDEAYVAKDENYQMIVRPLFITSFMGADFLQDNDFFGAKQIIVSSASSKTAYGTAFCLNKQFDIRLIAMTSVRNRAFVESLGCYDRTISYDELDAISSKEASLYLDFSGDEDLRAKVHRHFGDGLTYDCFAGSAQNTDFLRDTNLPGPKPILYFAPVQIKKRNIDWGHDVVNQRFNAAQRAFIQQISQVDKPWMEVVESHGYEEAQQLIAAMHAGKIDPRKGNVLRLA